MMKNKFLEKILDEIYGEKYICFSCEDERLNDEYGYLCPSCYKRLHIIRNACQKCGSEVNDFTDYCDDCKKDKVSHLYDRVYCATMFDDVSRGLVYKFKYGKDKSIAKAIIPILCDKFLEIEETIDLIMPVPLSRERMGERGFNQAEILARGISEKFSVPLSSSNLIRNRNTPTQTSLDRDERKENLKDAFSLKDAGEVKGKIVLIIDDLTTSGATMDEITKILKKNGATAVFGLTFCHAQSKYSLF